MHHTSTVHASAPRAVADSSIVLIADDEKGNVALLEQYLRVEGYRIVSAYHGAEALDKALLQPPDLVLLDVMMPKMDGYEICRKLKSDPRTQLVPVVLITALQEQRHKIIGLESGADDFLRKPVDKVELLARVRNLIRIKRLTDQLENTEAVIFTLAMMVEAKDPYTAEHLERMAALSGKMAAACGLDPRQTRAVRYGAMLHDIGKIGVSEAILRKIEPLSDEEFAEVQRHPIIGTQVLQSMRFAELVPFSAGRFHQIEGHAAGERRTGRFYCTFDTPRSRSSQRYWSPRRLGKLGNLTALQSF